MVDGELSNGEERMAYVSTGAPAGQTDSKAGRISYAIEYSEQPSGRKRRKRCSTLGQAFSFTKRLPLGADPAIRVVVRQKKA